MSKPMIVAKNLVFDYPGHRALDDVSLKINRGSIVALVGPNGAGKTTLIRCLVALARPLSGSVTFNGVNVHKSPRDAHKKMGYLADFIGLYDDLSVNRSLKFAAKAAGLPWGQQAEMVARAASRLDLTELLGRPTRELSRGQRQRVAIAQAIVHEPEFLVLDEPAAGLDPEARHGLSQLIVKLRDQGTTLLVSSHILAELEDYCTEMVVIRHGRLVGTQREGRQGHRYRLRLVEPNPKLDALFKDHPTVNVEITDTGRDAWLLMTPDAPPPHELLKLLVENGIQLTEFKEEDWRLQDSYMAAIGARDSDTKLLEQEKRKALASPSSIAQERAEAKDAG